MLNNQHVKENEMNTTEKPPSRINGERNPDYWRWHSKTEKSKASQKRYRQSEKGKEKAKIARARRETPDQFAERIMEWINEGPESLLEASDCPIQAAAPSRPSIDVLEYIIESNFSN
tara:strand:+ start:59 stop:409 length:351 start_codon:yes stop_codon:yes gene_type:complete